MFNLPLNSSVKDIVTAHRNRLQQVNQDDIKLMPDPDAVFAFQEQLRLTKKACREDVG